MRKPGIYQLFKKTGSIANRKSESSSGAKIILFSIVFAVLVTAMSVLNPETPVRAAYVLSGLGIFTGILKIARGE